MPTRNAQAVWEGGLKDGKGSIDFASGAFHGPYSFGTRFENAPGTNPEELIAAAHASCFSMALSLVLGMGGHTPTRIQTKAAVTIDQVPDGFAITKIHLNCEASVPGIDAATFAKAAEAAKTGCPVSKALSATPIELDAKLVK